MASRRQLNPAFRAQRQGLANGGGGVEVAVASLDAVYKNARRSGTLSLPNRGLTAFPAELGQWAELTFGENWWELVDLARLDLSLNNITTIPPFIADLSELKALQLGNNKLEEVPDEVGGLRSLGKLVLCHNAIRSLPDTIGLLTSLGELDISYNHLVHLPHTFCLLESMSVLDLSHNALSTLPDMIGELRSLRSLKVSNNRLTALPTSIAHLRSLEDLEAASNQLATIPSGLDGMIALKRLDLKENRIAVFPPLPPSPSLADVSLGFNRIRHLPKHIEGAPNLSILDVRDNKIVEFPAELVESCRKLVRIDLRNNDLPGLPPEFGLLQQLNHVELDGNPLRTLRRATIEAGTKEVLKVLKMRLPNAGGEGAAERAEKEERAEEEVRTALAQARFTHDDSVTVYADPNGGGRRGFQASIDVSNMSLSTLPAQIFGGEGAERLLGLNVSANPLQQRTLPVEVGRLQALQSLSCQSCNLRAMPMSLFDLKHLQSLDMSGNTLPPRRDDFGPDYIILRDLLDSALPRLRSLENLRLDRMGLELIPAGVFGCGNLRVLSLCSNRIEGTLPGQMASMPSLEELYLSHNHLSSISKEYAKRGTKASHILHRLDLAFNNLPDLPPSLGFFESLRSLTLEANPLRRPPLRRFAVSERERERLGGTPALLESLRQRATGEDMVDPAEHAEEVAKKHDGRQLSQAAAVREDEDVNERMMREIEERIAGFEAEMERGGQSQAMKFAIKKKLQMERAAKIRLQRKIEGGQ